eukprot:jgi/Mesvir1/27602/Mv07339-RA.1
MGGWPLILGGKKYVESMFRRTFVNGLWRDPVISARNAARLRKEARLANIEWPLEEAPAKPERMWQKGHRFEKEKLQRLKQIEQNMANMPKMLEEFKKKPTLKSKDGTLTYEDLFHTKEISRAKIRTMMGKK